MRTILGSTMLTLMIASTLAASAHAGWDDSDRPLHERYKLNVKSGGRLEIRLDTGAELRIVGGDSNVLTVSDDLGDGCKDASIAMSGGPSKVTLKTTYRAGTGDVHTCSLRLLVRLPKRFDLQIKSSGGDLEIEHLEGTFKGGTGGGDLRLVQARGRAELETGGGSIEVRDSSLDGSVGTGGGSVKFANVSGGIVGHSGSEPGTVRADAGAR